MPLQILFVDDSVTMQRAMQITFSREDAQVSCVSDGAGALAQARQMRPDVIVVDVTLAQGDGYTVCQSLKAEADLAQVPVMLLGNKQNPIDEAKMAACGAQSHSLKPFDTQTMVDKVRALANLPPVAAPAAWTPRPASATPTPVAQVPQAPVVAPTPTPTPRPIAAAPQLTAAPQATATSGFAPPQVASAAPQPAATSIAGAAPAQVAPRPVVHASPATPVPPAAPPPAAPPPAAPPPQRPSAPQPMAGGWSMTPAPAGSGPPPGPPRAPVQRPGAPVSGAPPAAFHAPPAAARPTSGLPPRSPHAGMAQTASSVAAQSVGQALHKAGIPVDQTALMNLAREIIERVAWEVIPELAETMIREQLARQQKF